MSCDRLFHQRQSVLDSMTINGQWWTRNEECECERHERRKERTRSRASSCSSLTIKIISNRDRIVVWKSIFFWRQGISRMSDWSWKRERWGKRRGKGKQWERGKTGKGKRKAKLKKRGTLTDFTWAFHIVISSKYWISRSQNTGSRVQYSGDTRFRDRNSLLLHCFVNGDSILVSHFIKFIDTDYSSICQYHGSAFQEEFSLCGGIVVSVEFRSGWMEWTNGQWISLNRGSQSSSRWSFTRSIDSNWRDFLDKLE